MKTYIAGPFFNDEQKARLDEVEKCLHDMAVDFFSPMKECLFVPGETSTADIFKMNMDALHDIDFLVCITDGKDVGTIFEAGYVYGKGDAPIFYVWLTGKPEDKFNIMLAESGSVARSIDELGKQIDHFIVYGSQLKDQSNLGQYE